MKINIGIVDDHRLFLKSLSLLLKEFVGFNVMLEALNGKDLQEKLAVTNDLPDIMLVDVNMPQLDGEATVKWLHETHPLIKCVALSMKDDDRTVIKMIKAGCCAYLLKDIHPDELERAIHEIWKKEYYNGDACNINYRRLLNSNTVNDIKITDREKLFLELACSDKTYKHIASLMGVSERTVDSYRESLFEKLVVQSRVGMCLEAIKKGLIDL
ncbi:MAG: response regulator transcription factor [Bacteroidetes bacterium]|nr:response regulator transcription factor [Bacteroidota bacterium]